MNKAFNEVTPQISQNGQYAGEGVKKREPRYTAGGNVNWYSHYGKQCGIFHKKLVLPYDLAISPLSKYLDKTVIVKYKKKDNSIIYYIHSSSICNSKDKEAT